MTSSPGSVGLTPTHSLTKAQVTPSACRTRSSYGPPSTRWGVGPLVRCPFPPPWLTCHRDTRVMHPWTTATAQLSFRLVICTGNTNCHTAVLAFAQRFCISSSFFFFVLVVLLPAACLPDLRSCESRDIIIMLQYYYNPPVNHVM